MQWLDVFGTRIEYDKCNIYQKAIYEELLREAQKLGSLQGDKKIEQEGVINYLAKKLLLFGTLTNVPNVFTA